jgi:hypothetical protein
MSNLSEVLHGRLSPADFVTKSIGDVLEMGHVPAADAADGAADQIETVKAQIEQVVDGFLIAKLGPLAGNAAARVADAAINSIAAALEAAAHAAAHKPDPG